MKSKYPNAVVKGRDLFDAVLWSDPASTALFYTFLANLRAEVLKVSETTPAHKFIRTLAETGRLLRCYTQNIDGLEEREGLVLNLLHGKGKRKRPSPALAQVQAGDTRSDQEKGCQVVQLHGNLKSLRCTTCQLLTSYTPAATQSLLAGAAPVCKACQAASDCRQAAGKRATKVGLLRPNVVLYGEEHPDADMVGSLAEADIRAAPDLMIILGTSLKVHGLKVFVKQFARAVHARGGRVVFVNNTPPPDSVWSDAIDFFVAMDCDAWVADVKARRAGIWEKQTRLSIPKASKALGKKGVGVGVGRAGTGAGAGAGDKENIAVPTRKILEPKTPSKGRKTFGADGGGSCSSVLQPTTPPPSSTRKRASKKKKKSIDPASESDESHHPPIKRRKLSGKTLADPPPPPPPPPPPSSSSSSSPSSPLSPPSTPTVKGGRAIRIEVHVTSPQKKRLHEEIVVFEDHHHPDGSRGGTIPAV